MVMFLPTFLLGPIFLDGSRKLALCVCGGWGGGVRVAWPCSHLQGVGYNIDVYYCIQN